MKYGLFERTLLCLCWTPCFCCFSLEYSRRPLNEDHSESCQKPLLCSHLRYLEKSFSISHSASQHLSSSECSHKISVGSRNWKWSVHSSCWFKCSRFQRSEGWWLRKVLCCCQTLKSLRSCLLSQLTRTSLSFKKCSCFG